MKYRMKRLIRSMLCYKKKWAAAGLMLLIGMGVAVGAHFYVRKDSFELITISGDVMTVSPETEWVEETTAKVVAESTAAEKEWIPTPGELNLAHFFPEGADQSDVTKSLAGEAFRILMTHDEEWISGIYDFSDVTPSQMASRLGKSQKAVMGRFNPKDSRHDRSNPDSWTINTFKNIRMTARDGDGNSITPYSNVLEIMSMANLYTYFKGVEDYDLFLSYSKELWELSHSYTVSISDVYYCSGCMSEDAERREMEELEAAAKAEALGLTLEETTENSTEGTEAAGESSSAADASTASSVIIAGISASEKASEAAESEAAALKAAAATQETVPESTSRVIVSRRNVKETLSAEETLGTSPENTEVTEETSAASESTEPSESIEGTETGSAAGATPSDASAASGKAAEKSGPAVLTDCPGHVDLIINMKIIGLDEENNLFTKDTIGGNKDGFEEGGWQGWNQYTKASARLLSSQDWFEKYGLTVSSISARNPLTESEIEAYMAQLPADLSQTRKDIIRFALSSVGKVPYYWGGKPSAPNYAANSFGVLITPDYKGRVYKGLDCSGWINWVYWSATGRRLPYESTSGLAAIGTKIQRNELQPGDIIVRTGADAHVIMFLGWTADGQILCIHESSASVNNVTVAVRDANWAYYRRLVD